MPQETFDTVLPEDFDGVFRFTNWTEEDFLAKWDSREYRFPAKKRTPMVIINASPLEVQNIRKKFAKELAEREFFKSERAKAMTEKRGELNSIHQANSYSLDDLQGYIQRCLEPLAIGKATVRQAPTDDLENKLSRDPDGEIVTAAVDKKVSLREKALQGK